MKVLFAIYDNGSYDHVFPMGVGAISAVLKKEGHEIHLWNQDMHHYQDEKLTEELDKGKYDVIIMSLIAGYYQYKKMLGLSRAINDSKFRPTYLLGGYGPTPEPEFFINKTGCDIVCLGEGEITAVKLLKCLEDGSSLHEVPGIVWKDENGNDLYLVVNDWVEPRLAVTRTKHMEGLNFYPNTEEGKIEALNKTFQERRKTRGEWLTTKDYWLGDPEHKNNPS